MDHNIISYDENTVGLELTLRENSYAPCSLNNSKRIEKKLT